MLKRLARATRGGSVNDAAMTAASIAAKMSDEDETDGEAAQEDTAAAEDEPLDDDETDDDGTEDGAAVEADDGEEEADAAETATATAVSAETSRIKAIVTSKAGMENPALAHELAFDTDGGRMSAERAERFLAKAGASQPAVSKLSQKVSGQTHGAGSDHKSGSDTEMTTNERREAAREKRKQRNMEASRS